MRRKGARAREDVVSSDSHTALYAALDALQDPENRAKIERRWQDPEYRARTEAALAADEARERMRGSASWKVERVLALWESLGRIRVLLADKASAADATSEQVEEFEWFEAKLAKHYGRAKQPWDLLEVYRWYWRVDAVDGAELRARCDDFVHFYEGQPLRRSSDGGAASGQGRRLSPATREAIAMSVEPVENAVRLMAALRRRDGGAVVEALRRSTGLRRRPGRPPPPDGDAAAMSEWLRAEIAAEHTATVRWAARHLWQACAEVEPSYGEPRLGRDELSAFRGAWRLGPESNNWTLAVAGAMGAEEVAFELDRTQRLGRQAARGGTKVKKEKTQARRGGPRAAAAIVIEMVTGVSQGTIETIARNFRPRS